MNTRLMQLNTEEQVSPRSYRDALLLSLMVRLAMAAVLGMLYLCVVLIG
jgi:hypothetical protein